MHSATIHNRIHTKMIDVLASHAHTLTLTHTHTHTHTHTDLLLLKFSNPKMSNTPIDTRFACADVFGLKIVWLIFSTMEMKIRP